jgi:predicted anti-sigma-YlaC factor YlaD
MQGIALLGTLTALLGLVGLFLHFSVVAGVVFTLCCLVGIVIIGTGVLILYQAEEAIPKLKDEDHDVSEVSKRISSSLPEIRSNFL